MHPLLERQLRQLGPLPSIPALAQLIGEVNAAYEQADRDRLQVELSLELTSQELVKRSLELRADIERRKQLELDLSQADKLRAVGQLAAGIAHEINTPIQYVSDNLSFLQRAFQELSELIAAAVERDQGTSQRKLRFVQQNIPGALDSALEGCRRVAEIVSSMKFFAHRDGVEFCMADINRGLTATLAVARNTIKYNADVELELGELPAIECQIGELNQVFLNLLTNAVHAIIDHHGKDGPRGLIRVSSRLAAERVIIEISDNGGGIPAHVQPRIFEPFFTTKEVGRGTGQGLAISRSIVAGRHHGSLFFRTTPGEGTTFVVELPVRQPRAAASPTGAIVEGPAADPIPA